MPRCHPLYLLPSGSPVPVLCQLSCEALRVRSPLMEGGARALLLSPLASSWLLELTSWVHDKTLGLLEPS